MNYYSNAVKNRFNRSNMEKRIYRSNLECPDLTGFFRLRIAAHQNSMGHVVPSDPDYEPGCGFWTWDEAAILYNIAEQVGGHWIDIGSRFGWTAAHLLTAGATVVGVDPEYCHDYFSDRLNQNLDGIRKQMNGRCGRFYPAPMTSQDLFAKMHPDSKYDGFVIDGNHDAPYPLKDAIGAAEHSLESAVIVFHDFMGRPIRDGVRYLIENGWKCRVYWTPNGVALCWRGFEHIGERGSVGFMPPHHVADSAINWSDQRNSMTDFDFTRCL